MSRKRRKQKRRNGKTKSKSHHKNLQQLPSGNTASARFVLYERVCGVIAALATVASAVSWFSNHKVAFAFTAATTASAILFGFCFWYADHVARTETDGPNVITPGSEQRPQMHHNVPADKFLLILGDFLAWKSDLPMVALMQKCEALFTLNKEPRGMSLSAKFFNSKGKIVAEIDRNEIEPNPANFWRLKKTAHRLTIFDDEAKVVVDVLYSNPKTVKILGRFFGRGGMPIVLNEDGIIVGGIKMSKGSAGEFGLAALSFD